jgi:hypothetical protein
MNKLLRSMTKRTINVPNENKIMVAPDRVAVTIDVNSQCWRYFENLDEDSRAIIARVVEDYVERQR